MTKQKISVILLSFSLLLVAVGCKKKVPPPASPPPPKPEVVKQAPPPPPTAPTVSEFVAEPSTIERGQAATLRWKVSDATGASIEPGIGTVQVSGSRRVFPSDTTTYTLRASGPGGTATASATVSVTVPTPPPPPPAPPPKSFSERVTFEVQDAYFDFDRSAIREDARATLWRNSDALKAIFQEFPGAVVVIEGHCDERGSAEYNLGLGDRRAQAAREFLLQVGVLPDRLKTVSYGKERPQCTDSNEECWQKNRRVHLVPGQ